MQGTYWLTVLPETSKLRPGIKSALRGVDKDAVIRPQLEMKGARAAGQKAGQEAAAGVEAGAGKGGGLGRLLRIDGARTAGQRAGAEVNAGLASSNIGASAGSQLSSNMLAGARGLGAKLGSLIGGGLKIAAVGAGTVAAAGLGAALHAGFSRLTAIDDAKFKLQGLGNSTEKVQSIMDNALAAVKGTAFGLDEAATTAASAVAAGIKPGEELTGYLKLTADTAAIAGTNLADMGGIFNSVQTSGKAMTGDLRMLADRGLPVFQWLQEATGKTGEDFNKMVEDGGISAQMFRDAVAKNIAGAAQNMGQSVRGSLSNLKAAFSRFGAELSGPIFAGLKPLAIGLTGTFDSVTAAIKPMMADLAAKVGPWADGLAAKMKAWADNGGVQKIVAWFTRMSEAVKSFTSGGPGGGASTTLQSITDSAKAIGPALQSSGPALAGFGDAAKQFGLAMAAIGPSTLSGVLVPALNLLAGALKFVADNASWAVPVIGGLVLAFGGFRMLEKTLVPVVAALNGAFKIINAPIIMAQTVAIRAQAKAMEELTVALGANAVAQGTQGAVLLGTAAATDTAAVATKGFTAALLTNPITLIIAGVVAAGVALWAFFTKTETGRKLWDKIWTGIKTTVETVWNWLKTTLAAAWTQIGPPLMQIAGIAKQAFGAFAGAVKTVWTAIQPAVAWVGRLWMAVAKMEFGVAVAALKVLGATISWLWSNVVVPAFQGIATAVTTWWGAVQWIWAAAQPAIRLVGDVIMWLWNNVAIPAFAAIGSAITTWWDGVQTVWGLFKAGVDIVGTAITTLKDGFVTGFNAIKGVVETVWNFISGIFDKIGSGVGTIVDKLRSIPGIGSLIPGNADGRAPGFAAGSVSSRGVVAGPGTGTSDSILARISDGEGIVKASAMQNGGGVLVAALNAGWTPSADMLHAMFPGFAEGLNPGADWLRTQIMQTFPSITTIGGRRSEDGYGEHSSGNALDIMIPDYAGAGKATGDQVASWIAKNKDALGADGMIWRQTSFGYGGDWSTGKPMSDRGSDTQNHMDHVHVILGKGRGAGAAKTDVPSDSVNLASSLGGGSSGGLGGATSGASSSRAVTSARNSVRDAGQAVDDRTFARDQAQKRLDEAKAAGKDTEKAQHSLDVANRELTDAKERQTKATDNLTEAQNATVDQADKADKSSSGGGFDDLGKSLWGGLMETIGLDGSVFSNPFEWPTVKSAMAGVNFLGAMLKGDGTDAGGAGGSGGSGDLFGGLLSGAGSTTGLDALLNPAALDINAAPANNVAPDTTAHGTGAGQPPGPGVYIENAGMKPTDVANVLDAQWNNRTRTTVSNG